jgi:adenosylhomocysteine nucleosidase
MWLRFVVSNLLNQIAEQKLQQVSDQVKQSMGKAPDAAPEDPQRQSAPKTCDVVVAYALNIESCGLVDRMSHVVTTRCRSFVEHAGKLDEQRIVVVETGVGRTAAQQATEDVIKLYQPQWVISAGFAGALSGVLQRGHILMPDKIIDLHSSPLHVGFQMDRKTIDSTAGLHVGSLLTVDELIRDAEVKRDLHARFGAIACDMETMAVAQVCQAEQVRFLSVRVISDGIDDRLPEEVEHLLNQVSLAGKFGAATRAVFKRPSSLKDMWNLRETALRASDRLSQFLTGVVPQLTSGH